MKKIIIINNNMKIGGVQKSLYNLLWQIGGKYDVTLCLFKRIGEYANMLPPSVKVVETRGLYRYLGMSQGECRGFDCLIRGCLVVLCRIFGRRKLLGLIKCKQPELLKKYDAAIAYLHNGRKKAFYGGTQDFVLDCVEAEKKIAFLHCDYGNCGADNKENNKLIEKFDVIAACSDGCRAAFCAVLPHLSEKCVTVQNCHRFEEIRNLADNDPYIYNEGFLNVLITARLSHEKGIERAIRAVAEKKHLPIRLYVVGNGAMRGKLLELTRDLKVEEDVFFCGEQSNPYRYMKNADLLLISSYHEAAPMVIDEARSLGLPILTTKTTSSKDMVCDAKCGWECENSQNGITQALGELAEHREKIVSLKREMSEKKITNSIALSQFDAVLRI